MLVSCSSCNSKYLVNSADLKPAGRTVRCVKCRFDWFQTPDLNKKEEKEFIGITKTFAPNENNNLDNNKDKKTQVTNLPTTYVPDQKPSIINTSILLFSLGIAFFCFWIIKNENYSFMALINFYIQEFYFNLNLIIDDMARIIHQILN